MRVPSMRWVWREARGPPGFAIVAMVVSGGCRCCLAVNAVRFYEEGKVGFGSEVSALK
jgi:predicted lysophospholipase L1 biosynthesis ABC-type transport system permease subunit